jgi:hypothetical protein
LNARRCLTVHRAVWLAVVGTTLGGCSMLGRSAPAGGSSAEVAQAQTTHEYPSPRPPRETVVAGSVGSSPVPAIRKFAAAYVNWSAPTVAADMRTLAAGSVGQARSALQLAAAQTANDYELRRGGIANAGTIEAVAPLLGSRNRYVVVTRETTTASATDAYQGLQPAWHLTIATVVSLPGAGWVLSGWQPES